MTSRKQQKHVEQARSACTALRTPHRKFTPMQTILVILRGGWTSSVVCGHASLAAQRRHTPGTQVVVRLFETACWRAACSCVQRKRCGCIMTQPANCAQSSRLQGQGPLLRTQPVALSVVAGLAPKGRCACHAAPTLRGKSHETRRLQI